MSNTAKGTAYEQFVQALYQTLHDAGGFDEIKVEHNKTDLVGRSGCAHQIDVYWELRIAGQLYRTAIECKAFDGAVPIGRVRDFYGVLADVPGLHGIFVSLFGFQSGAKQYADHYGITLKEIREPTDGDWEGRIKNIRFRMFVVMPQITAIRPDATQAYLNTLKPGEQVDVSFSGTEYDPIVVDSAGNHVASIEQIRQQLPTDNQPARSLERRLDNRADGGVSFAHGIDPGRFADVQERCQPPEHPEQRRDHVFLCGFHQCLWVNRLPPVSPATPPRRF